MNRTRIIVLVGLLAIGVAAGAFALRQRAESHATAGRMAAAAKRQTESAARATALEQQLEMLAKHTAELDADNGKLREAVIRAQAARTEPAAKKPALLTRQALEERFRTARDLVQGGDPAQALRELLWCWDEGIKQFASAVGPAQRSFLTDALRELAERYPPAREELQKRRDATRGRILATPGGSDYLPEYTALLRALKEEPAVLGLLDEIKPGDPRRRTLAIYAGEQLLEARRYNEAMEGRMTGTMFSMFETKARMANMMKAGPNGEASYFVTSTAKDIELLAGSGNLEPARELANRLFAVDKSEGTRALVQQKLERAGQPDLLK